MRRFFRLFRLLVIGLILATIWGVHVYQAAGPLPVGKVVLLPRGQGLRGIAQTLENEGVVDHAWYVGIAALATGKARNFKAGEYDIPAGISLQNLLDMLVEGRVVIHKLTVPEGLTVRDIVALLAQEPALNGDAPTDLTEGSLLPETYHFILGDTRATLLHRMQKSMQETLTTLWEKRAEHLPLPTQDDALILASIVEKETGVNDERARVAAVFENRLRLGMRLQSDPTVAYDAEQAAGAPLGRSLTTADLEAASPHNTYIIVGLPPTAICNPGRAALEAVLHPAQTNDLYFVATGHGGHHFAATLEEHNRNVATYRATLRAQHQ